MDLNKNKVAVGLSGGVDSAATAYLLKQQGYEVIGVTLYLFDYQDQDGNPIQPGFVEDARKIAEQLEIPHYVEDLRELFDNKVRAYFEAEYLAGRTPNPCVVCNKHIKYGELIQRAHKYGAYYLATGHYAKVVHDESKGVYRLYKGSSDRKDQAYVMNQLSQEQLKYILLPLGAYEEKAKVREIASHISFEASEKKDSVGICFIEGNHKTYLTEKYSALVKSGDFLDKEGNSLGKHQGIIHYTIGQKRNLGIDFNPAKYVVRINSDDNTILLGDDKDTYASGFRGTKISFTTLKELKHPIKTHVKVCQWGWLLAGTLYPPDALGTYVFKFCKPERAIAPGQTAVFYAGDEVLGGLTIDEIIR